MRANKFNLYLIILLSMAVCSSALSQDLLNGLKLKTKNTPVQQPTKKVYFVPGGKFGMFFLQGDFADNQLIALEGFGQYRAKEFFAEIGIPFRFKTNPGFTDIGLDINAFYPFLGSKSKSEIEPYAGGGFGIHFIGYDKGDTDITVAARGGLGMNLIAGVIFMKNYDFNIVAEVKFFYYLRELDDKNYYGIGLNIGAMLH